MLEYLYSVKLPDPLYFFFSVMLFTKWLQVFYERSIKRLL